MIEFDWLIHYRCNYRCPYCFFADSRNERTRGYLPPDRWVTAWRRIAEKCGTIKILVTGGEPFIYPGFVSLMHSLSACGVLAIDTNLSCSLEELRSLVMPIDPSRLNMGVCFHPLEADRDSFLLKARLLKAAGIGFRVQYVAYPPHLENMKVVGELAANEGIRFAPIPFRGRFEGRNYPESYTERERESIFGVTGKTGVLDRQWSEGQVSPPESRGRWCRAGQQYARVDSDGSVYPCGHDQERRLPKTIFDPDFALNDRPMLCRRDTCSCGAQWLTETQGNENDKE